VRVCALVPDLMDRARVSAAVPDAQFVASPSDCTGADVVVVDLARRAPDVASVRRAAPAARVIGFGPHVDGELRAAATRDGADAVLPRSRFFRDVAAAIGTTA
jgi:hypothetical protein